MKWQSLTFALSLVCFAALISWAGCSNAQGGPSAEAPVPSKVVPDVDLTLFSVEHPEQFPLVAAAAHQAAAEMGVTGTVKPAVSRHVPVVSLASGRVLAI